MDPVLVHCASCGRTWHSVTMAEGLRLLRSCPRCSGTLVFHDAAPAAGVTVTRGPTPRATAPHLVLGIPRR